MLVVRLRYETPFFGCRWPICRKGKYRVTRVRKRGTERANRTRSGPPLDEIWPAPGGSMPTLPHRPTRNSALALAAVAAAAIAAIAPASSAIATPRGDAGSSGTISHKQIVPARGSSTTPRATSRQEQSGKAAHKPAGTNNGISYHGGPVLLGTTNVYYIWYGDWSQDPLAQPVLTDLASNIGGSPYFNINTGYYNGSNQFVSNSVHYAGSTTDNYSLGRCSPTRRSRQSCRTRSARASCPSTRTPSTSS